MGRVSRNDRSGQYESIGETPESCNVAKGERRTGLRARSPFGAVPRPLHAARDGSPTLPQGQPGPPALENIAASVDSITRSKSAGGGLRTSPPLPSRGAGDTSWYPAAITVQQQVAAGG
jgi:hypothetical protein